MNFRFDPEIIEERKKTILEFLYYCAENPVLYRSQSFVKFFEGGEVSPSEEAKEITDDNESSSNSDTESRNNSVEYDDDVDDSQAQTFDNFQLIGSDYLYEAAICFSRAVQEEANLRYKAAFELYKIGIDNLLTGAKNDTNENRKRIAKTKAEKYLERAESLYENQISQNQVDNETFIIEQVSQPSCENATALEMPLIKLSDYKLVSINNCLMRVKDTNNKFYLLKTFRKDQNSTISFPKNIPYMVKLINYFKAEDSIFLLLPMISGGLLWDYVNSYTKRRQENHHINLEEMFVEPPKHELEETEILDDFSNKTSLNNETKNIDDVDEDVVDALKTFSDEQVVSIPSFETLSSEMDINDLLSCSMNLLQSVSKTLEKSRVEKKVEEPEKINFDNNEDTKDEVDNYKLDENESEIYENLSDEILIEQKLPESVLKQWTCELIVAVNSLHSSNIICGDLNLDNLLLGPEGHLTLTYFFQKTQDEFQQLCRLNPNAMKCQYVAFDFPITRSSDWYSVGVIMYELWTQERFYQNHPIGTFRFNEIQFTNPDEISENLKDLLHGLIIEKSENRLTYQDLTCHPFFTDIDWLNIEQCGIDLCKKF
jgi:ribosomal protein S6 kinase-like